MSDNPLYSLSDLHCKYGDQDVLRGLDIEFHSGNFYGIVGPNGSGKTTLLDVLAGIKRATRGTAFLLGKDLGLWRRRELAKKIALVPQDYAISFDFTVQEVVMMGRHPHIARFQVASATDWNYTYAAIKAMGLLPLKDRGLTTLSGGEKQRVAVARAIAQDADIILLDEATSNLDIRFSLEILGFLKKKVSQEGKTVIAVFHDLNLAAMFSDKILIMKDGNVVAFGECNETLTPANIQDVFGVKSSVNFNMFSNALHVSYSTL